MNNDLRVFFVGGYLSYRALFNWMHPSHYIPTMLGAPVFQVLFFAYIGRFAELEDDTFFVTGNAVQLHGDGGRVRHGDDDRRGALDADVSPLMASPANRLPLFLGRSLPLIVNGIITSAFAFFVGWLLLDFELSASQLPALGSRGGGERILLYLPRPPRRRDRPARTGRLLPRQPRRLLAPPLLRCERPARRAAELDGGRGPGAPAHPRDRGGAGDRGRCVARRRRDLVWTELAIGVAYATVAYALFRFFEIEGRRRATLETI